MIDLCFLHAEIGRPEYRPMTGKMVRSFREIATDGDRIVQFADATSEQIEGVDVLTRAEGLCKENLMLGRIGFLQEHFRLAAGHIVLSDADMIWHRNPNDIFDEDFDIGLLWRVGVPSMPYLGGLVFARQGSEAALHFITNWHGLARTLPREMHGWWGDQLALAIMLGSQGKPNRTTDWQGARVKIFDAGKILHSVRWPGQPAAPGTYATHYKGAKKDLRNVQAV